MPARRPTQPRRSRRAPSRARLWAGLALLVVFALGRWLQRGADPAFIAEDPPAAKPATRDRPTPPTAPSPVSAARPFPAAPARDEIHGWTRLAGCTLVEDRFNDGDNVVARHLGADGRREQETVFRLYFVDTPESRDKPYEDHRHRVEQQGAELGGLDYGQTLELGRRAKARAHELLSRPFTVWTRWQEVYESRRSFALIQLEDGSWLHERLIREGLARVHTEGTDLPDGTDRRDAEAELERWQREAVRRR